MSFFKYLPHILIILVAIILAWLLEPFQLFNMGGKRTGTPVNELLKMKHKVIGNECILDTNICFLIVDSYYLENRRLTTKRDLLLADNTEYSLTGVEVESAKEVTWDNIDSRNWPVNKLVINSRYARLLVAAGFIMESLTFDEATPQEVLIAGLGGGVMSNFLSEISYLNIATTVVEKEQSIISLAENYFDHFENDYLKVINADIVKHFQKSTKKYDVILMDTCENKKADVMCPTPEILNSEFIQVLRKRLTSHGTLGINILPIKDNKKHEATILQMFEDVFPSCFYVEYIKNKKVLLCSNRENWTWKSQRSRFLQNVAIIDDMFEFRLSMFLH